MRFAAYTDGGGPVDAAMPPPPALQAADGPYARLAMSLAPGSHERLLLILALAPYLAPERLDALPAQQQRHRTQLQPSSAGAGPVAQGFPAHGGNRHVPPGWHRHPAAAGAGRAVHASHPLQRQGVLQIVSRHADEPPLSGVLRVSSRGLHQLLHGDAGLESVLGADFPPPAPSPRPLDWCDLVLGRRHPEADRDGEPVAGAWAPFDGGLGPGTAAQARLTGHCSMGRRVPARPSPHACSASAMALRCTGSICRKWSRSGWERQRGTWPCCSTRPKRWAGSCSSTRPMPSSAGAARHARPTTMGCQPPDRLSAAAAGKPCRPGHPRHHQNSHLDEAFFSR